MKVRCERDGTEFEPLVNEVKDSEGVVRQRYINCPTCYRGYYLEPTGIWESDRPLTILEE